MVDKSIKEIQAIRLCVQKMQSETNNLVEFIQDTETNKFKKWHVYKVSLSQVLSPSVKGRTVPIKNRTSSGKEALHLGNVYEKEKNGIRYIPQLPLHKCKTLAEKVSMISGSDCSAQVKADLICSLY